jgi:hypothetical protein
MSIFYKTEQKTRENGEQYAERQMRGWAKWAAYIGTAAAIGIGINHFTGDPSGLEKMVGVKQESQVDSRYKNMDLGNLLKTELLKQKKLYLVQLIWNGQDYLAGAQLKQPVVADTSYTAVEKFYFLDLSGFPPKVETYEPPEAFKKDLEEKKVQIVTAYATGTQRTTQQTGQNPLQSMTRMLRSP